jgi:hypothetical protein
MFVVAKSGKSLDVVLPNSQRESLINSMKQGSDGWVNAIVGMRPSAATCFDPNDLEMIRTAVSESVGWTKLKEMVVAKVNTHIYAYAY